MKTHKGLEVRLHTFLNSELHGGEWSASHSGRSTSGKEPSGSEWMGIWGHRRARLDEVESRKNSSTARNLLQFPIHPARNLVLTMTPVFLFPFTTTVQT
jgi:hypothetical protein